MVAQVQHSPGRRKRPRTAALSSPQRGPLDPSQRKASSIVHSPTNANASAMKKRRHATRSITSLSSTFTQTNRAIPQIHVPAWRRLGLVLRPRKPLTGQLSTKTNEELFNGLGTNINSDCASATRQSAREHSDIDNPNEEITDICRPSVHKGDSRSSSPPSSGNSGSVLIESHHATVEHDNSDNERQSVQGQNSHHRLRRRTKNVSYVLKPKSDIIDLDDEIAAESMSDNTAPRDEGDAEPKPLRSSKTSSKSKVAAKASTIRQPHNGIDSNLPPLHDIQDIFLDMTAKALDLGLDEILEKLGDRPLNIGTMCSGTEAPLIALDLVNKSLEQLGKRPIRVHHKFSVEIDVVKQAYIERNFKPAKLFRDVREFIPDDAKVATTAYGAEELIPGELFMLIVGFVCKDLSNLHSFRKGLEDGGESGDTWNAIYSYVKRFLPPIVLVENVQSENDVWNGFKGKWNVIGYEYCWKICDTKDYYIPQTRKRMYMIAIKRSHFGIGSESVVEHWKSLMVQLQRRASSPFDAFLSNSDDLRDEPEYNNLIIEPDWKLGKLRYDQIRAEEGLGIRRPITRWSDNGTFMPPDNADRKWYRSQSSRVYECIDIACLQAARKGFDALYKMMVWDVSQNVDRFKAVPGIVSCITPGGCDFVTHRQTALTGAQLLLLQGIPHDKLLFGKETQKELQDLAGNAMTTTVIGASIISALISSRRALRSDTPHSLQLLGEDSPRSATLIIPEGVKKRKLTSSVPDEIDLQNLIADAALSSRLCNCEGSKRISRSPIQKCSACGHTTCSECASHPEHVYSRITISRDERKQTPHEFERKWRPLLPHRLALKRFPDMRTLTMSARDPSEGGSFASYITKMEFRSQYFIIQKFERQYKHWKILYVSREATLELRIADAIQWLLRVRCPKEEPANGQLRRILSRPLARGLVQHSLLRAKWEVFLPADQPEESLVNISASPKRITGWRGRYGMRDYQDETLPTHLNFNGDSNQTKELIGLYDLLPHCGTAKTSLYKKGDSGVFLFFDPDLIGPADQDTFIFSYDHTRLSYGESRMILGALDPMWGPWNMRSGDNRHIRVITLGVWSPHTIKLESALLPLDVSIPSMYTLSKSLTDDCFQAITILDITAKEALDTHNLSWILEQVKTVPCFQEWQTLHPNFSLRCECSPSFPRIIWSINEAGDATAHEDPKACASFESALKARSAVFQMRHSSLPDSTRIQIGINISSMIHRARSRVPSAAQICSWRLITSHIDSKKEKLPRFRLRNNGSDAPYAGALRLRYNLVDIQRRSLEWMRSQELGEKFTTEEVEEQIHSELGWRIEARAKRDFVIRGGVLADLPSFGKTVTTIGLIHSEFEQTRPETLVKQNRKIFNLALISTAATLVVCPPHIAQQWRSEFKNCLDEEQFKAYNILLIESFADLKRAKVEDLQQSQVVIVSWGIITKDEYFPQLARFSGMPMPASTKGRAFDVWLNHVLEKVPDQVQAWQRLDAAQFNRCTKELLERRLMQPEFHATAPLKISHGSAYKSFDAMRSAAQKNRKCDKLAGERLAVANPDLDSPIDQIPLLHMFNWNRIIIDEYHYLYNSSNGVNNPACAAIQRISALKRWALSGTPPLNNFTDVNQIASFLGVRLGRDVFNSSSKTTELEKRLLGEQSAVERFLSRTESMSFQWHQARHQRAQDFLDRFVRRNEASLQHIACREVFKPIQLSIAHQVVYLELSQHLSSQRMQIKRLRRGTSDRAQRLHASLTNSTSAEEALLKAALLFKATNHESGLDMLIATRQRQLQNTKYDILDLAQQLQSACLVTEHTQTKDLYQNFIRDINTSNILGDQSATQIVRELILDLGKGLSSETFKRKTKAHPPSKLKELAAALRSMASELTIRLRSERFIAAIKCLLPTITAGSKSSQRCSCNSTSCTGASTFSGLFLAIECGHLACESCLRKRMDTEVCVYDGCEAPLRSNGLINVTDLGLSNATMSTSRYGEKLDVVSKLIKAIPEDDQAIVFVPNDEALGIMEEVFDNSQIGYHSLGMRKSGAAKTLEDFKLNKDTRKRKKVLILNLRSESAAGANLVNANHILFVSSLLAKSQDEYESVMAQANARSRRYGQEKTVYIYHFAALRTIDVDILEHRHERIDAIYPSDAPLQTPPNPRNCKEKTRVVRSDKGTTALVPLSWLANEKIRNEIGVEEVPERFTSIINFSETFEGDDE